MKYLCFILYLHISFQECTIDINIPEFVYLADHLTAEECRRLFASLHFLSYDLPETLADAEKNVPKDVPCIKLLIKWNGGDDKWDGKGKTHVTLEKRLRQIGKRDLADWLGKTVFHQLSQDLNDSLEDPLYFNEPHRSSFDERTQYKNEKSTIAEEWSSLDSILCVTLFGLLIITMSAFCRVLRVQFWRDPVRRKDREELVDLLSTGSVDSDQETVYELDIENEDNNGEDNATTSCNK